MLSRRTLLGSVIAAVPLLGVIAKKIPVVVGWVKIGFHGWDDQFVISFLSNDTVSAVLAGSPETRVTVPVGQYATVESYAPGFCASMKFRATAIDCVHVEWAHLYRQGEE